MKKNELINKTLAGLMIAAMTARRVPDNCICSD